MGFFDFFKKGAKKENDNNVKADQGKNDLSRQELEIIHNHNRLINQKIEMIYNSMPVIIRQFPHEIKSNFELKIRIKLLLSDIKRPLTASQIKEADDVLKSLNNDKFMQLLNELSILKVIRTSEQTPLIGYIDGPKGEFIELLLIEMYKIDIDEKVQMANNYLNGFKDIDEKFRERILDKVRILHAIEISHRPLSINEINLFDKRFEKLEMETMIAELEKSNNITMKHVDNEPAYSFVSGRDFIQNDVKGSQAIDDSVSNAGQSEVQNDSIDHLVKDYTIEVDGFIESVLDGLNQANIITPAIQPNVLLKARLLFLLKKFDMQLSVKEMQQIDSEIEKESDDKVDTLLEELRLTNNVEIINGEQGNKSYKYLNYSNFYINDLNLSHEENNIIQEIKNSRDEVEHYGVSEDQIDRESYFEEDLETLYYTADNFEEIILRATTSAYSMLKVFLDAEISLNFSVTDDDGYVTSSSSSISFLDDDREFGEELWNNGFHILLSNKAVNLFKESPQSPLVRLCGAMLFSNILPLLEKDNDEENYFLIERYGEHFASIVESCLKLGSQCGVEEYCLLTGMYLDYPQEVKRAVEAVGLKDPGKKLSNLKLVMKELGKEIPLPFDVNNMIVDYIDDFLEEEIVNCKTKEFSLYRSGSREMNNEEMEPLTEDDYETETITNSDVEEIIDFIPLSEITKADFLTGGRISRSINHYLVRNFETYKESTVDSTVMNSACNELFLDLANIVDFKEYTGIILANTKINGSLIKALFLQTINHFWNSYKNKKEDFNLEEHLKMYETIFNTMIRFIFSNEMDFEEEEYQLGFGVFGSSIDRKTFNQLLQDNQFSMSGIVVVDKLQFINNIVKASMNRGDMTKPLVNGKINTLKYLTYLSDDAIFYLDSHIDYDGENHNFTGIEFNSARIWLHPDILLDLDGFVDGMVDLGQYVEENDNLRLSLDHVDQDIHDLFMDEDITGISLINLFTSGNVRFKIIGNNRYLIHLDDIIKGSFPDYEKYLTELITTLRAYNNLDMKNVELIFDDVFEIPSEIKDLYNIDESTVINMRFINS